MELKLRIIAKCPRDHWMLQRPDETVIASRTIEVPSLELVKFTHTETHRGWFSNSAETYDAVRYAGTVFRLQYDLLEECWVGESEVKYPSQGCYYQDHAETFIRSVDGLGWEIAKHFTP